MEHIEMIQKLIQRGYDRKKISLLIDERLEELLNEKTIPKYK